MMTYAYSVFDNKALLWSPPFFTNTDGAAIRMFSDAANDTSTNLGRHPGDYALFCIGTFSDANGSIEPHLPLRHIIDASALLTIKPQGDLFSQRAAANGAALLTPHTDDQL